MRYPKINRALPLVASLAAVMALSISVSAQQAQAQQAQIRSAPGINTAQYRGAAARLTPHQVRAVLQRAGYRRISAIQCVRVGDRRDFYRATAWAGGRQYRLRVSDENGRIINRVAIGARQGRNEQALVRGVDRIEVRQSLVRQGYTGITGIRFIGNVRNDHFVATAWKNGRHYRLKIDDDNGRILARTLIR